MKTVLIHVLKLKNVVIQILPLVNEVNILLSLDLEIVSKEGFFPNE